MQKRLSCVLLLLVALCATTSAQDGSGFSLRGEPAVLFPFPSTLSAQRFSIGFQGAAIGDYVIPALPFASIAAAIDYALMPYVGGGNLQTIGASAGGGLRLRFLQSMSATVWARGGFSLGIIRVRSTGNSINLKAVKDPKTLELVLKGPAIQMGREVRKCFEAYDLFVAAPIVELKG